MSYRTTGPRDSALEPEAKADWAQGVNTILPKDRLGPFQLHHLLNGTLRKGYPETRPGARRAPWLYNADGTPLAEVFQGTALIQSSNPDPRARLPVATLVIGDNNLWLCAPNNVPHLLKAGITTDLQPCRIIDAFDHVLILRNLIQAPVRYKYVAGGVVEDLPAPRETMTALPPAAEGCYTANRIWLKFGKSEVIASDILEWDYRPLETRYLVDDGEGDEILRLWPAGENRIVVFKERSVHVLDGITGLDTTADPPVQLNKYRVAAARGAVSADAIEQKGQAIYYLSSEGIEVLNLTAAAVSLQQDVPISGAAQRYLDEVRWRAVRGAKMAISSNYLMLAVPTRWGEKDYVISLPGGEWPDPPAPPPPELGDVPEDPLLYTYLYESWEGTARKCGTLEFVASERYRVYRAQRIIEVIDLTNYWTYPLFPRPSEPETMQEMFDTIIGARVTRRFEELYGVCTRSAEACALSGGYTARQYYVAHYRPTYDPAESYATGAELYYDGDEDLEEHERYFKALEAIAPGEDPTSEPAKWENILLPDGYLDNLIPLWGEERGGSWNLPPTQPPPLEANGEHPVYWGPGGYNQVPRFSEWAVGCEQVATSGFIYNLQNGNAGLTVFDPQTVGYGPIEGALNTNHPGLTHLRAFARARLEDEDTWTDALIRWNQPMITGRNYTEIDSWDAGLMEFHSDVSSRLRLTSYPNTVGETYRIEFELWIQPLPLPSAIERIAFENFFYEGGNVGDIILQIPGELGKRVTLVRWKIYRVREQIEGWNMWPESTYGQGRFLVGEYEAPAGATWKLPGAWELPAGGATHIHVDGFAGLPDGILALTTSGIYWPGMGVWEFPEMGEAIDGFVGVPAGELAIVQSGWGWSAPGLYDVADDTHSIDTFAGIADGPVTTITSGDGSWPVDFPGVYEVVDEALAIDGFAGIADGEVFEIDSGSGDWADVGVYETPP